MSSKRKSRSSRSRRNAIRPKRKTPRFVNFSAMVFGMIMAMVLIAYFYRVVWGPGAKPTTEMADVLQPALPQHASILQSGNAAEIFDHLLDLDDQSRTKFVHRDIDVQNRRLETAHRLIEIAETAEYRDAAIKSSIQANENLYQLYYFNDQVFDPVVIEQLHLSNQAREAAEPYLNHEKPEIVREANMVMLTVAVLEYTNAIRNRSVSAEEKQTRLETCRQTIKSTIDNYDEDPGALDHLHAMLRLFFENDGENAADLIKEVFAKNETQRPPSEFLQDFYDISLLKAVQYEESVKNRWLDAQNNRYPLFDATLELFQDETIGPRIVRQTTATIAFFELIDDLDRAGKLLEAFREIAPKLVYPELGDVVQRVVDNGFRRIESNGKRLKLDATSLQGVYFNNETLKDKIVVLFFWSGTKGNSFNVLRSLQRNPTQIAAKDVVFIVVCMDTEFESDAKTFVDSATNWTFIDAKTSEITKEFPVATVPHIVVLNRKHEVARMRASFKTLPEVIENLSRKISN